MEHQCHESQEFSSSKKWRCSLEIKGWPWGNIHKAALGRRDPFGHITYFPPVCPVSVRDPNYEERGKQIPGSPAAKPGNRPLGLTRL